MDYFDEQHNAGLNPMIEKCRNELENNLRLKTEIQNLNDVSKVAISHYTKFNILTQNSLEWYYKTLPIAVGRLLRSLPGCLQGMSFGTMRIIFVLWQFLCGTRAF